ncbi:hypothetical protein P7C70_g8686, partial [Phenoliferia sp. Uapishka_3]
MTDIRRLNLLSVPALAFALSDLKQQLGLIPTSSAPAESTLPQKKRKPSKSPPASTSRARSAPHPPSRDPQAIATSLSAGLPHSSLSSSTLRVPPGINRQPSRTFFPKSKQFDTSLNPSRPGTSTSARPGHFPLAGNESSSAESDSSDAEAHSANAHKSLKKMRNHVSEKGAGKRQKQRDMKHPALQIGRAPGKSKAMKGRKDAAARFSKAHGSHVFFAPMLIRKLPVEIARRHVLDVGDAFRQTGTRGGGWKLNLTLNHGDSAEALRDAVKVAVAAQLGIDISSRRIRLLCRKIVGSGKAQPWATLALYKSSNQELYDPSVDNLLDHFNSQSTLPPLLMAVEDFSDWGEDGDHTLSLAAQEFLQKLSDVSGYDFPPDWTDCSELDPAPIKDESDREEDDNDEPDQPGPTNSSSNYRYAATSETCSTSHHTASPNLRGEEDEDELVDDEAPHQIASTLGLGSSDSFIDSLESFEARPIVIPPGLECEHCHREFLPRNLWSSNAERFEKSYLQILCKQPPPDGQDLRDFKVERNYKRIQFCSRHAQEKRYYQWAIDNNCHWDSIDWVAFKNAALSTAPTLRPILEGKQTSAFLPLVEQEFPTESAGNIMRIRITWGSRGRMILIQALNSTFGYASIFEPAPSTHISLDLFYEYVLCSELGIQVGMSLLNKSREETSLWFEESRDYGGLQAPDDED